MDFNDGSRIANIVGTFSLVVADRQKAATNAAAELEASAPTALVTIFTYPGISVSKLSDTLQQSHSGTVRLVDRLQNEGLVVRARSNSDDARAVTLTLTKSGQKRVQKVLKLRRDALTKILAPLSEQERGEFCGLIEKILSSLNHTVSDGYVICRLCELAVCPLERCPVARSAK
ncbi:MAG: MarR family transcriptional regulator [Mesorhizobium sp.]|uniref:MarR family winged helix-turn-helix transcriptional regulator n=1 Tax=Mesorhizobium sp. TaxID=1871066 RepID=UPI000FE75E6D|nr:MarR family transcriptional regulator [Mesorhizobium sp.]RWB32263.1 MAG: MarR family transcriptional regulator [Mesorhizobium sp.]RWB80438.1 MAG: MarR family transcriptional regulator [Mesorhizobium sp.]RWF78307.1 MAG: MarR family transcriptional regulator [Mesorhizobium sp.]TIS68574.1 MAG: MarR family transcriptional regulator [Mesorhizobium sp.]TIW45758.1 MAG: MarR family transcriptional regulator [Mesorhizobium sp.]